MALRLMWLSVDSALVHSPRVDERSPDVASLKGVPGNFSCGTSRVRYAEAGLMAPLTVLHRFVGCWGQAAQKTKADYRTMGANLLIQQRDVFDREVNPGLECLAFIDKP